MKFKATKREMKANYNNIITIGYCAAQFLLKGENPIAYSTRSEGWACDYYDVDGVLISTGYAPLQGNVKVNYDIIKRYESKAEEIARTERDYDTQISLIHELLKAFIAEVV